MKTVSSLFAFLLTGLLLAAASQSLAAAATDSPAVKTGAPATRAEWDKLVTEAKKEGKVVIYAGPIGEARSILTKAFRDKYGISLDIVVGRGAQMEPKVEVERRAGIYAVDVGVMGMESFFASSRLEEFTVPLAPLLVLPEILDLSLWREGKLPFADKEGHMAAMVLGSAPYLLINTGLVKPGEIKSHQDLLDTKWRGKLIINDPSVGGAGSEWFTFIVTKVMGIEKGTAFMKQLAKQEPAISRDQRLLSEWVARGKYVAALGTSKTVTAQLIRAGVPMAFADLKEPRPTSSGTGNVIVFDRAPHPNAAKLFVNWILSREGAAIYSKAHGYAATRRDVSAEGIDPILIPRPDEKLLGEDYEVSKEGMRKLAAEIFRDLIR